jgi:hypothetical protein
MFGLVLLLEENSWHGLEPWYPDVSPVTLHRELALARTIASLFAALVADNGGAPSSCGAILTQILSAFVELFGPGIGHLSFEAETETIHLVGLKRRALVLAAIELIGSAMLYGARRPHTGHFRATLRKRSNGRGEFSLEHDGDDIDLSPTRESFGVLSTMATLLEAELTARAAATGGPAIAFDFPC